MRARLSVAVFALAALAACGGGGGGGNPGTPPTVHPSVPPVPTPTPTPTSSPGPYATLSPASSRQGDVKALATGSGASAMAYWPDYNVVLVASGNSVVDAADGTVIATAPSPDPNYGVTAIAYSPASHGFVFSTGGTIYSYAKGGPVQTVAINMDTVLSLAVAADGSVYSFDRDHIDHIVSGVAANVTPPGGFSSASYAHPYLVFASDGSLLVSDAANDVIDHVTTSGSITPFAGSCKAGAGATGAGGSCWRVSQSGTGSSVNFGTPGALAYDTASGTLYVADPQNEQLWAVTSSGAGAPVAGYGSPLNIDGNGLAAFLDMPSAVAFQPASKSVDILEDAATQQEVAAYSASGSPAPPFTPPATAVYVPQTLQVEQLASSSDGGAWAAENNGKTIDRVSPAGSITKYATPSGISATWHVAVDANGNAWYLASHFSNTVIADEGVLEVTPSGSQTYVAAATEPGVSGFVQMESIVIGSDGNPWFSGSEGMSGGAIGFVNPTTHAMTQFATSTAPGAIAQAPAQGIAYGTFLSGANEVQFVSLNGQFGASQQVAINGTYGLLYRLSDSTLWFADASAKIASLTSTGVEHDYAVCQQCDPVDLTVAPDGSIWSDEGNGTGGIVRITPSGQIEQYLLPIPNGATSGISARSDGRLWVYTGAGVLFLFDPAAYDAMSGPHPTQAIARVHHSGGLRVRWHRGAF